LPTKKFAKLFQKLVRIVNYLINVYMTGPVFRPNRKQVDCAVQCINILQWGRGTSREPDCPAQTTAKLPNARLTDCSDIHKRVCKMDCDFSHKKRFPASLA